MNGLGQIETDATDKSLGRREHGEGLSGDEPEPGPMPDLFSKGLQPEPGGKDKTVEPAMTRTIIVPTTDAQMEGALCRAQIEGDGGVMVLVNKDHSSVQEALKAKPTNRLALLMMIVHEISEVICALDNSGAYIRKMFSRSVASSLNNMQSPRDRARRMARLLIDRVQDRGEPVADAA